MMQRLKPRSAGPSSLSQASKRGSWAGAILYYTLVVALLLVICFVASRILASNSASPTTTLSRPEQAVAVNQSQPKQTVIDSTTVGSSSQQNQLSDLSSGKASDEARVSTPSPAGFAYATADYRRIGEALDPDVTDSVPESFNVSNINPCWNVSSTIYCLPYFYFLGGFQSGTFTLYDKVAQHPSVAKGHNPRYHFWAEYEKKFAQYMKELSPSFPQVLQEGRLLGDASESYWAFYWAAGDRMHRAFNSVKRPCREECIATNSQKEAQEACWRKCYPLAQAADHKAAADLGIPFLDVQLPLIFRAAYGDRLPYFVVLIRNPIRRIHSAFWEYPHYPYRYNGTAEGFLSFVKEQLAAFRACVARGHTDVECALLFESLGQDEQDVWFHCDQVMRGLHSIYLKIWLQHFPRERFLFIRSEDYFADVNGTVKAVMKHLGLPDVSDEQFGRMVAARPPSSHAKEHEPMLPEAWRLLDEFYQPYNEEMARLLGDKKFAWLDDRNVPA